VLLYAVVPQGTVESAPTIVFVSLRYTNVNVTEWLTMAFDHSDARVWSAAVVDVI
jgi:hypothetical protein